VGLAAELRTVLDERHFRRLFATRLVGQCADGVLQASLAGAVFFNPDHTTDAHQAATGFAVLLLPYSLVGPFAGVLLDRWRRQRILDYANLARAALGCAIAALLATLGSSSPAFYLVALVSISVNRFYLSALSAALPHVVARERLVVGNSLTTTLGFVATIAGGGAGLVVRLGAGGGDRGDAVIALCAAMVYLVGSRVAAGFRDPDLLGPDERATAAQLAAAARAVVVGMRDGARHVWLRRRAAYALIAIGAHRFFFGISTIATLLLYRNYFTNGPLLRNGVAGVAEVLFCSAAGTLVAAAVTPGVTHRVTKPTWITTVLALAAVVEIGLGAPYTKVALLVAAVFFGFCAQALKICVDTIVQETIDEGVRGRVFAFYDTLFNVSFVAAAVAGAFLLPASGKSYGVLATIALGYGVTAVWYAWSSPRGALVMPVA
jgi:hypothetical protein